MVSRNQDKKNIICMVWDRKNDTIEITICHHSTRPVMANCDCWNTFFYTTLTSSQYDRQMPQSQIDLWYY